MRKECEKKSPHTWQGELLGYQKTTLIIALRFAYFKDSQCVGEPATKF